MQAVCRRVAPVVFAARTGNGGMSGDNWAGRTLGNSLLRAGLRAHTR